MAGYMQCFRLRLSTGDPPPPLSFCLALKALMLVAMQDMQSSKTSFQLVSIDLGRWQSSSNLAEDVSSQQEPLAWCPEAGACCPLSCGCDTGSIPASQPLSRDMQPSRPVEGPDCFWIFKYGATSRHSHKVRVISLATAVQACQQHGVHPAAIAKLAELGKARPICYLAASRAHP